MAWPVIPKSYRRLRPPPPTARERLGLEPGAVLTLAHLRALVRLNVDIGLSIDKDGAVRVLNVRTTSINMSYVDEAKTGEPVATLTEDEHREFFDWCCTASKERAQEGQGLWERLRVDFARPPPPK